MSVLDAFAVPGLPEVRAGDDLAALLVAALDARPLRDGDIVVVSSKVVSKAEGRSRPAAGRAALIEEESRAVVAERLTPRGLTRIVRSRSGPVLAAAGVDASNVPDGRVLALPVDPDASARRLHAGLRRLSGRRLGVVITDTAGRAWRDGQVDIALGAAGVTVLDDLRGTLDAHGMPLEVTVRAVADEVASLADLVKGKRDGLPAAVVRGLGHLVRDDAGPGTAALLRPPGQDWFRLGHAEAARAALGLEPGDRRVPPQPLDGAGPARRLRRALAVARGTATVQQSRLEDGLVVDLDPDPDGDPGGEADRPPGHGTVTARVSLTSADPGHALAAGALAQRLVVAAWAEGLHATSEIRPGPAVVVECRIAEPG